MPWGAGVSATALRGETVFSGREINAFVAITAQGEIEFANPGMDLGQGAPLALAMILAARPLGLFQCSMTCAGMRLGNGGGPLLPAQRAELQQDSHSLFAAAPELARAPVQFLPGRPEFARLSPAPRFGYPLVAGSSMTGDRRDRAAAASWVRTRLPG